MRNKVAWVLLLVAATLVPSTAASATTTPITLDGVQVELPANTTQVITARHTIGTYARITFWTLRDGQWVQLARTTIGRTGYGGLVDGSTRRQGSGSTPLGTYYLPWTFGSRSRHTAWSMPYRRFGSDDYWVEDNASAYYNRYRSKDQGGFRWNLDSPVNGSERLAATERQYRMTVVVAFNYYERVHYRGAGIFLHVNGPGPTAGCVSAPTWFLRVVMDQLDPASKPVIAIGR